MTPLLSADGLRRLEDLARDRALIVLDFDGTLAPIVEDPRRARMRERTRSLLRRTALDYPCAVISGRARADVLSRLDGASLVAVVGNHGVELEAPPTRVVRARVRAWASALREALDGEHVELEDKGFTIAVHYRRARSPGAARDRILSLASGLPGARVFGGHAVVNIAPADAPNKADAVATLARRFPARPIMYIGDDETDEDAFRAPAVTTSVRVGRSPDSAATFFVEHQEQIDDVLSALAEQVPSEGGRDPSHRG